jgi:hypothetical protein
MKHTDYNAHEELKVQRIGKPDPNAWRHIQASRHVKAGPDVDRDVATLAAQRRRETWRAIGGAVMTLAGSLAVIGVALLFAVSIFGGAA